MQVWEKTWKMTKMVKGYPFTFLSFWTFFFIEMLRKKGQIKRFQKSLQPNSLRNLSFSLFLTQTPITTISKMFQKSQKKSNMLQILYQNYGKFKCKKLHLHLHLSIKKWKWKCKCKKNAVALSFALFDWQVQMQMNFFAFALSFALFDWQVQVQMQFCAFALPIILIQNLQHNRRSQYTSNNAILDSHALKQYTNLHSAIQCSNTIKLFCQITKSQ